MKRERGAFPSIGTFYQAISEALVKEGRTNDS